MMRMMVMIVMMMMMMMNGVVHSQVNSINKMRIKIPHRYQHLQSRQDLPCLKIRLTVITIITICIIIIVI